MLKKIAHIAFWLLIIISIPVLLSFASAEHKKTICKEVCIDIDYSNGMYFLSNNSIIEHLKSKNIYPLNKYFNEINCHEIEKEILALPEVKSSNVFKTINGEIGIKIEQRVPLVRIINYNGNSFYIDSEGYQMPVSSRYSPRVLVVNGYINDPPTEINIAQIQKDSSLSAILKADDIWNMAQYITKHDFWNSQIQQIYIAKNGDMELIPVVGNHKIIFGQANKIENKFEKLWLFYNQGLKNKNWNQYETINLKYKNQIVCTKKQ